VTSCTYDELNKTIAFPYVCEIHLRLQGPLCIAMYPDSSSLRRVRCNLSTRMAYHIHIFDEKSPRQNSTDGGDILLHLRFASKAAMHCITLVSRFEFLHFAGKSLSANIPGLRRDLLISCVRFTFRPQQRASHLMHPFYLQSRQEAMDTRACDIMSLTKNPTTSHVICLSFGGNRSPTPHIPTQHPETRSPVSPVSY